MVKILVKDSEIKINSMKPYSKEDFFLHGMIILDKPAGPKSKDIALKLKNLLEVSNCGHAGTLDPKVTGVLPIGLEKSTKVLGILTSYPKTYEGEMKIHKKVPRTNLNSAVKKFTGKIKQLPPKISAVKREYRIREVYSFEILGIEGSIVSYRVKCEAGTYIRKLCHDLGEYLSVGAHMTKLRRTQSGPFTLNDSVTLDDVVKYYKLFTKTKDIKYLKKFINPVEVVVKDMPKVWIDDGAIPRLAHGSPVFAPGVLQLTDDIKKGTLTAIMNRQNRLVAIGNADMTSKQILKRSSGLAIKTDTVLIKAIS